MALKERKTTVAAKSIQMSSDEMKKKIAHQNELEAKKCADEINSILERYNCVLVSNPFIDLEGKIKSTCNVAHK